LLLRCLPVRPSLALPHPCRSILQAGISRCVVLLLLLLQQP
jgi:hypothetical protein